MNLILSSFVAGWLFGLGLVVSQMINPAKVLGFLDLFGNWDPSLAFVMAGAMAVAAIGFRLAGKCAAPVVAPEFHLPTRRDIDSRLLLGAVLFGAGWGLAGFCPGPAVTAMSLDLGKPVIFVAAMMAGIAISRSLTAPRTASPQAACLTE